MHDVCEKDERGDNHERGTDAWEASQGAPDVLGRDEDPLITVDPLAADEPGEMLRLAIGESEPSFRETLDRFAPKIRATAWALAWYDRDLRDDLEQEGRIALWRLSPVRLAATLNPDGYRRAAVRHAMLRYLRTMSRQNPAERRIDWRIVEEVLETFGARRGGGRRAA